MYKKLKYFVLIAIIFFSGCSIKSSVENQNSTEVGDSISVKDSYITYEQTVEILKNIPNLTISDNFFVYIPKNLDSVSIFDLGYSERTDNKTFYVDFVGLFSYLFPDRTLEEDYFRYVGENSKNKYDEQGNKISDYKTVKESYDSIISDDEDVQELFYEDGEVALEFTSPICSVLSRFNRGKASKLAGVEISSLWYNISIVETADYSGDRLCLFWYNKKVMDWRTSFRT